MSRYVSSLVPLALIIKAQMALCQPDPQEWTQLLSALWVDKRFLLAVLLLRRLYSPHSRASSRSVLCQFAAC